MAGLALLWLALGVAIAIVAARRFRLAQQVLDAARANARLLALAPARPLLVRVDGRIETDGQLVRELGLEGSPKKLGDLVGSDHGIAVQDFEALAADISAAQASASLRPFSRRPRSATAPTARSPTSTA